MKKAQLGFGAIMALIIGGLIVIVTGGGLIKFMLTDRTPLILGGFFVLLILYKQKIRRG